MSADAGPERPVSAPPVPVAPLARVVDILPAGSVARRLRLAMPASFRWSTGQVASLGLPGGPLGYFAIASAPHETGPAVFLIKDSGASVASALLAAAPGDEIACEGPHGPGFDLRGVDGADLLLIGAGTGVAPLRSVLSELLLSPGRVHSVALVVGIRRPDHLAFADELPRWRAAGVRVRLVVSRPEAGDRALDRVGHVQQHLADLVTPNTVALIAGMNAMIRENREVLSALGVAPTRARTNLGG